MEHSRILPQRKNLSWRRWPISKGAVGSNLVALCAPLFDQNLGFNGRLSLALHSIGWTWASE